MHQVRIFRVLFALGGQRVGLATDHGDADVGHEAGGSPSFSEVWAEVRGRGRSLEAPHPKAHTILLQRMLQKAPD